MRDSCDTQNACSCDTRNARIRSKSLLMLQMKAALVPAQQQMRKPHSNGQSSTARCRPLA
eukprot:2053886-Pleurochrysis_carterae.AAC.1